MVRVHVVWLEEGPTDSFIEETKNKINALILKFKHATLASDSSTQNIYQVVGERNSIRMHVEPECLPATNELTIVWNDMYIRNNLSNPEVLAKILSDDKRLVIFIGEKDTSHSIDMLIVQKEDLTNILYHQACFICFEKKIEDNLHDLTTGKSVIRFLQNNSSIDLEKYIRQPMILDGEKKKFVVIKRVVIQLEKVTIMYEKRELNRMLYYRQGMAKKFIICQLDSKLAAHLEALSWVLGENGIKISDGKFIFVGHSNSQLKEFSCYLYDGSKEEVVSLWGMFGDFSKIKQVAKYSARIGLLFSSCLNMFVLPEKTKIVQIDDVTRKGMVFSDGCGLMSEDLFDYISEEILHLNESISVIQIRLRGCKGVFVKDRRSSQTIKFRPSMEKFKWVMNEPNLMGIVQYSKPFKFKYMNEQIIMLLSSLGVPNDNFLQIQEEYFHSLDNILTKREALKWLLLKDNIEDAEKVMNLGDNEDLPENIEQKLKGIYEEEIRQNMLVCSRNDKIKEKLRIPIMESRIVFGVCDDGLYSPKTKTRLGKGQCYCKIKLPNFDYPTVLVGKIVVAKNPCYHPGDIRILECVDVKDFEHLSECIIFNTVGDIPVAHTMAGSDLDGDQYFVCWDERLIPKKEEKPYGYPGSEVEDKDEITIKDMVEQFIKFDRTISGSVDTYYHFFKDRFGVKSKECLELGTKWFSKAVDSGKSGEKVRIPVKYRNYFRDHKKDVVNPKFVWNIMKQRMRERYYTKNIHTNNLEVFKKEDIQEIFLSDESFPYSEYQRFKMVHSWCEKSQVPFTEFIKQFNYVSISNEIESDSNAKKFVEHVLLSNCLDMKILSNGLYGSDILKQAEFKQFKSAENTDLGFWKLYWRSDTKYSNSEERILLFKHLLDSLKRFKEVMFVFEFSSKTKLVIEIESKSNGLAEFGEFEIPYGVSSYLISYGKKRPYFMSDSAVISISEKVIQIYRRKKGNTFVWMKLEELIDEQFVNLSVDIESFEKGIIRNEQHPRIYKQTFEFMEIFIRQNDDNYYYSEPLFYLFENEEKEQEQNEWPFKCDTNEIQRLQYYCDNKLQKLNYDNPVEVEELLSSIQKMIDLHAYSQVVEIFAKKTVLPPNNILKSYIIGSKVILNRSIRNILEENNEELQKAILPYLLAFPSSLKYTGSKILTTSSEHKKYLLSGKLPNKKRSCSLKEYSQIIFYYILGLIFVTNQPRIELSNKLQVKFKNNEEFEISLDNFNLVFEISEFNNFNPKLETFKDEYINLLCLELAAEIRNSMLLQTSLKKGQIIQSDSKYILNVNEVSALDMTVGDMVLLVSPFSLHNVYTKPTGSILLGDNTGHLVLLGTVDSSLEVQIDISDWQKKYIEISEYHIIKLGNLVTFSRTLAAIFKCCSLTQDESTLISKILENTIVPGTEENIDDKTVEIEQNRESKLLNLNSIQHPATPPSLVPPQKSESLNDFQYLAIKEALSRSFHIVQGPPGTGKTNTIAHFVKHVIESKTESYSEEIVEQILAVSETNHATDNMLLKMMEVIPSTHHEHFLRVTGQASASNRGVHPNLLNFTLEYLEKTLRATQTPKKEIKKKLKEKVSNSKVICSTLAGCGLNVFKNNNIKYVIIDEISQTTVPKVLIALTLSTKIKHILLVGDDKQLPPTIFSTLVKKRPSSQSLYNYLVNYNGIKPELLKTQYRMHPEIVKFSNINFYGSELTSETNYSNLKKCFPVSFVNVNGIQTRKGTSLYNESEAKETVHIIKSILEENKDTICTPSIGIITPYLAQVAFIKNLLEENSLGKIEVKSVDGFQGREKEIIVISMVRSEITKENDDKTSFIADQRRMNVMLTRAKRALVVIGKKQALEKYDIWKKWFELYPNATRKAEVKVDQSSNHTISQSSSNQPSSSITPTTTSTTQNAKKKNKRSNKK